MKLKNFLLIAIFGMFIVSCKQKQSLKEYMAQSWETTYLKIEMATYEKSDSLYVYEKEFNENSAQVAQSKYNSDGTFSAWFADKNGGKFSHVDGKWSAENDSLFVHFIYNDVTTNVSYHITQTDEGFLGKSKSDWDKDGDFDDLLTMRTKRIKEE
ncbi:hypothetical protein MC378_13870 [Polaribacter sp. MSW13]|uniref:Lipocalin-like domain-containing protein n=1 Tax=Polaribacter marinus TaxID=2916838 RepID=A0A9X2AKA4_9FLAO|nr:hypothetical protein [Polaribacter marinus]MCI2230261.1 hypothetical protein [Polaribacter marinus]